MVGTLRSTDAAFTSADGREASTHFGVGYGCGRTGHPTTAHVHQYVRLGDQAWGNGNWDPSGTWDDRYPTTQLISRTVSIEHHDNGGRTLGSGKGVVPEAVIAASIALDALLLRGDLAELRGAVPVVQLDEGCIDRPGWGSPCGDGHSPRPLPRKVAWRARQDSNLRPSAPEADALSTELQARGLE
jgi:hypothetical protein